MFAEYRTQNYDPEKHFMHSAVRHNHIFS